MRLAQHHRQERGPLRATGKAGMVERQQAWWKSIWDRVIYQEVHRGG